MQELLPIIQRKRRPLQTAILPEKPPTFVNCPHCGRSLAEPASVTLDSNLPVATPVAKPLAVSTPNQSHDDAPEN
ncbi:MAG: hypothetical protein WCS42_27185 [Verrucomicrobiota bacterium]